MPAELVPHVVSVMFVPSMSWTLQPEADSVTVCDVASLEFVIVWSQVFVHELVPVMSARNANVPVPSWNVYVLSVVRLAKFRDP